MAFYAVQVIGGQEASAKELIERFAGGSIDEVFVPAREVMKRVRGEWQRTTEVLFPGYLFIETSTPDAAADALRTTPAFTRLLGANDDKFVPLRDDELTWLEVFTNAKTHVVEMSRGVIEGDKAIVVEGPLKGFEAYITKIDRHKRLAYMDMNIFGVTGSVRVGLEIVRKH